MIVWTRNKDLINIGCDLRGLNKRDGSSSNNLSLYISVANTKCANEDELNAQ